MKKTITTILLFSTIIMSAQSGTTSGVEKNMFKVNLLITPSLEYEVGLAKKSTLNFRVGTGFGYVGTSRDSEFGIFLTFQGAYRYYYNFERRASKGKKISGNSANYLAMTTSIGPGDPIIGNLKRNIDYFGEIGPVWGFQRTYSSGFNLGLELGVGYVFNDQNGAIRPIGNFSLGWTFGK